MQINLKQPEIIKAMQMYIAQLGINLKNKDVAIKFTAGRGEAGLSADIVITEDTRLPDFGGDEVEAAVTIPPGLIKRNLTVVAPVSKEPEPEAVQAVSEAGEEPEAMELVAEKPVKTASLFN